MTAPQSISRVRVRYAETDKMGVVYYAHYFVWFEVGRTNLLRDAGWTYREMEAGGRSLPVVETCCAYQQPARYDDELEVRTSGALLSPVRMKFVYEVVRTADAASLASGHTIHACVDGTGRPCRLPDRVRALFGQATQSAGGAPRHARGNPARVQRSVADTREPRARGSSERERAIQASGRGVPRESKT